jgi:holo-[acyl-carrier protein] synthase
VIVGIGTDVCDVRRIAATLGRKSDRFPLRVLGPNEQQVFAARRARSESRGIAYLATRFSAKEAFSKAIGLGIHMPMTWRSVQVLNAPSGKPVVVCSGALEEYMRQNRLSAQVTLSDEADYGVAFVIITQDA